MSRTVLPLHAEDISALARSLRGQLANCPELPSHLEMLNMLARGSGFRNFQHLRAQALASPDQAAAAPPEDQPSPPLTAQPPEPGQPQAVDPAKLKRLGRFFDPQGRLIRWPGKHSERLACLWVLWSRLPAKRALSEPQVKEQLNAWHLFGDNALLRRMLCDYGMVRRSTDCREYQRVEQAPPAQALALIKQVATLPLPAAQ